MNSGMKDMLNVMSKFLNMGPVWTMWSRIYAESAREIIGRTWSLSSALPRCGRAPLRQGTFWFVDVFGAGCKESLKLACELTVREGLVVYDLNGNFQRGLE